MEETEPQSREHRVVRAGRREYAKGELHRGNSRGGQRPFKYPPEGRQADAGKDRATRRLISRSTTSNQTQEERRLLPHHRIHRTLGTVLKSLASMVGNNESWTKHHSSSD